MAKFEAAIAAMKLRGARPRKEDGRTIEAIIWRLDNGAKWRSIPTELEDWHQCLSAFPPLGGWRRMGPDHGACGRRGRAKTGVCLHRWHRDTGTPEGCRCASEQTDTLSLRFNRNDGDDKQALGRSRGGLSSKIVGVCDAVGRLVDFVLVPGQAHELAASLQLLKRLPKAPAWALADMACDAAEFRSTAQAIGATPVVPSRKNARHKQPCPGVIYRHRNLIERCWSRLKEWRAIATRYDKTATSYAAGIAFAATLDWAKSSR